MRRLGAIMETLEAGRCALSLPYSGEVTQQHGFFHGGVIGALADTAGGYAAMTAMPDAEDVLALEYKINFLRPALGERLVAEGNVLRSGRSVTVVRVDVFAEKDGARSLCAASQQSIVAAPGRA